MNTKLKTSPVFNVEELEAIAKQLRCPTGNEGITMGEMLNESNGAMINESIKSLALKDKDRILELGHGSCCHLPNILNKALDLKYFGMEISEIMKNEAERINEISRKKRQALFQLYNGIDIPYVSNFFDKIITVNTIYFLDNPLLFMNEMYRLLKPNGKFVLTFVNGDFMKKLPFVIHSNEFNLFNEMVINELLEKTSFNLITLKKKKEEVVSKSGELVNREYFIIELTKKKK